MEAPLRTPNRYERWRNENMRHGKLIPSLGIGAVAILFTVALFRLRGVESGVGPDNAREIHVAAASNFADAIQTIARRFEQQAGHRVILSLGATGKHYAQITNGAPFHVFFAADADRPTRLESDGAAVPGSRFTYALGRLVLWSPDAAFVDARGEALRTADYKHLAVANPKLAPYGAAAQETLEHLRLWADLQPKIVRGENLGQTIQFIRSGAADLGFVAYAQIKRPGLPHEGSYWEIPHELYTPIQQQAVLLQEDPAARAFLEFVRGPEGREIIRGYGYGVP